MVIKYLIINKEINIYNKINSEVIDFDNIIKDKIKIMNLINGYSQNLNWDSKNVNESEKNFVLKNGIYTETKFLQDNYYNNINNTDGKIIK